MGKFAIRRLQLNEVFDDHKFFQAGDGHYPAEAGWYPLLGLPGAFDLQKNAVLFCRLQKPLESEVRKLCLNGVIEKIRIHRSARVKGPDSMLVLASDLIREFEFCQVPLMSEAEAVNFIEGVHAGAGNPIGRFKPACDGPAV